MGEERSNETVHAISRNHSLNEINGYVDSFMWETIEKGVMEMIVQVKTIEETGTDSIWIIKSSLDDLLSKYWYIIFIIIMVFGTSLSIVINYALRKRKESKSWNQEI